MTSLLQLRSIPSRDKWVVENCVDSRVEELEIFAIGRDRGDTKFFARVNGMLFSQFGRSRDEIVRELEATFSFSVKVR